MTQRFALLGVSCAGCVRSIDQALDAVPGLDSHSINFADRTAQVQGEADADTVIQAIREAGYDARLLSGDDAGELKAQEEAELAHQRRLWRQSVLGLGLGIPLMAWGLAGGAMTVSDLPSRLAWGLMALLTLAVLVGAGRHFFTGAWKAFRHHQANMDTLIALGTGAAWLYSLLVVLAPGLFPAQARHVYFEASAMIIGLINLGQALEVRARGKTSAALKRLLNLKAQTALLIRNGKETEVAVAGVQAGDRLRLKPGARVPVDGLVVEGQGLVDESMLTGEPLPQEKSPGAELAAGTLIDRGSLIMEATRVGSDTALARIIDQVKQAQGARPAIGRLADRISGVFVPVVLVIAIVSALLWYNLGPEPRLSHMLVVATSVLIIACPCALGLATPMSVMVGVGKAAEAGVLIRNGEALQSLSRIDTLVLDKTGTITQGRPQVTNAHLFTDDDLRPLVRALEQGSEHPLAGALLAWAGEVQAAELQGFDTLAGRGVSARHQGGTLWLGNPTLMRELGIDLAGIQKQLDESMARGATPVLLARDKQLLALFEVADPLKDDSAAALRELKAMGLELVMLSGDQQASAEAVARQVGIDTVIAQVLPEQKTQAIQQLQSQGRTVAMVGDGINDAPALAAANVGLAIGTGTDVAMASADLTLMRGSLAAVADAIAVSRATLGNIKQNLVGAFLYNSLGIPVAAGVLYPFTGLLLSPVLAGAAMALSSVTVVSNANRLRLFKTGGKR
ncbi:heavy metal translocating P-type ATPase [Gallaecimonas sp. GXIMD4217]|uniref:heavy metal translocating P-type ATPase n=1 Tax=Gallaecimonas sp. GXIMD4217 TaxID=3131927 RepID=UPI00311ACCCB